jgi:hypothetical protein
MPATWTSEEQVEFLKAELPGFLEAQHQQRAPRYLKGLAKRWFQHWSEHDILFPECKNEPLTADESEMLGITVEKRQKVR